MGDTMPQCTLILFRGWGAKTSCTRNATWEDVERYLDSRGIPYFIPNSRRYDGIENRANDAIEDIRARCTRNKERVHLIGHSFGGLIAREIAARYCNTQGFPFTVLTVTTFGTPHRGVCYVKIPRSVSDPIRLFNQHFLGSDKGGLSDLTRKAMTRFNEKVLNRISPPTPSRWLDSVMSEEPAQEATPFQWPGLVRYFSWAGRDESLPFSDKLPKQWDGVVSVDSATWGDDLGPGVHLGTVSGVTHETIVSVELFMKSMPHWKAAEEGRPPLPVEDLEGNPHEGFRGNLKSHACHGMGRVADAFAHRKEKFRDFRNRVTED